MTVRLTSGGGERGEVRAPRSLAAVSEERGAGRRRLGERLFGAPAAPSSPPPAGPQAAAQDRAVAPPREAPRSLRWAALVVVLEALGALAGAGATVWFAVTGEVSSTKNATGIVAVAVVGALLLGACAWGLWRVSPWARGPVVAIQLLLALLGYTAAFEYGAPPVGIPLLVLAAAELYFLATPESRLAYLRR
jgi:hypothetical protein